MYLLFWAMLQFSIYNVNFTCIPLCKVNRVLSKGLKDLVLCLLHTWETILKPCTFFQFVKVPCNLCYAQLRKYLDKLQFEKIHQPFNNVFTFFVLLFCTFKSIEALVKCNGIVRYLDQYIPQAPPGRGPNLLKVKFTKQNHEFESTSSQIAILIFLTYVLKKNL